MRADLAKKVSAVAAATVTDAAAHDPCAHAAPSLPTEMPTEDDGDDDGTGNGNANDFLIEG